MSRRKSTARDLLNPTIPHALTIGNALAVFQQITDINTIIYEARRCRPTPAFGSSAALLANVVNGGVNVAMTIVATRLLDRVGRRPLLLTGTSEVAVGMAMLAFTFLIGGSNLHGAGTYIATAGLARLHRLARHRSMTMLTRIGWLARRQHDRTNRRRTPGPGAVLTP